MARHELQWVMGTFLELGHKDIVVIDVTGMGGYKYEHDRLTT